MAFPSVRYSAEKRPDGAPLKAQDGVLLARRVAAEVFNYPEPFGVPNEFFLVAGRKMSSSKGEGAAAKEIVSLVPPKIFRLALFGRDINQQINFDPEGDTIPVLWDQYDKLAASYWAGAKDDYARLFEYLCTDRHTPPAHFLPCACLTGSGGFTPWILTSDTDKPVPY